MNPVIANPDARNSKETTSEIDTIYFVYYQGVLPIFKLRYYTDLLTGLKDECEENGIQFHIWELNEECQLPMGDHIGIVLLPKLPDGEIVLDRIKKWKEVGPKAGHGSILLSQ